MKPEILLLALLLASCAIQKNFHLVGGNRAAGFVEFRCSYDGILEKCPYYAQSVETDRVAADRCAAWGYDSASPFGVQQVSQDRPFWVNGVQYMRPVGYYIFQYQCLGDPDRDLLGSD